MHNWFKNRQFNVFLYLVFQVYEYQNKVINYIFDCIFYLNFNYEFGL